jgi:hypothetical protein
LIGIAGLPLLAALAQIVAHGCGETRLARRFAGLGGGAVLRLLRGPIGCAHSPNSLASDRSSWH